MVQRRRPDAARELAELRDRLGEIGDGAVEQHALGRSRSRPELVLQMAKVETDGDEPLLRSVVQVSLQSLPLLVRCSDDPSS